MACEEQSRAEHCAGYLLCWTKTKLTVSQPFNAFLSGFSAAVGQFVLTASLRMQTSDSGSGSGSVSGSGNKKGKNARVEEEGMGGISHERLV